MRPRRSLALALLLLCGAAAMDKSGSASGDSLLATLGVTRVQDDAVSLFVVQHSKQTIVVDCGRDSSGVAIRQALEKMGLTSNDVVAVFLTRLHPDHIGACHLFKHAKFFSMAAYDDARRVTHGQISGSSYQSLEDGKAVQVGDTDVIAYWIGGHSPEGAAYLIQDALFLGDAASMSDDGSQLCAAPTISNGQEQIPDSNKLNVGALRRLSSRLKMGSRLVRAMAMSHSDSTPNVTLLDSAR